MRSQSTSPSRHPKLTISRLAFLSALAFIVFAFSGKLHAQSGTSFVYPLTVSPQDHPTYNEALTASVLVRDNSTLKPLTGTVNFTVDGGSALAATLNSQGLAYANLGQLSIGNHTVLATYTGNAQYSSGSKSITVSVGDAPLSFVGTQGTTLFADGAVGDVEGVAVNAQDDLYIADRSGNVVRKEDTSGNVTTIPLTGLKGPIGLALDSSGNLYIADTGNNRILKFDTSGAQTTVPVTGLSGPTYLAYDRLNDLLYVVDPGNNRIVSFAPATKSSTNVVTGMTALLGVTVDGLGNLYFSDRNAGFMEYDIYGNQIPIFGAIVETGGIVASVENYLVLSDQAANTILRYDNSSVEVSGGHQLQINNAGNPVIGMAADSTGRVYLALGGRVDVLDTGSGRVPDVPVGIGAGGGNSSFSLIFQTPQEKPSFTVKASPAATFNKVNSVYCPGNQGACAVSLDFVPQIAGVDTGFFRVEESSDLGDVPLWGKGIGGGAVFSPGLLSQSSSGAGAIGGVALDSAGNRYVTDSQDNKVFEISPSGTSTTLPFTGLSKPTQISVDALGAVYVLDSGNQRIVRLSADGVLTDFIDAAPNQIFSSITAFRLDGDSNLLIAGIPGSPDADVSRKKSKVHPADAASGGSYVVDLLGHHYPPDGSKTDITNPFEGSREFASNLPEVTAMAIDAEENVFAVDITGNLSRFGIDGSTKQLATGLGAALGVQVDSSGTVYVLEANSVSLFLPDGSKSSIAINGLYSAAAFALDPYGDILLGDGADKQLIYLDRTQQNYVFGDVNVGQSETLSGSIGNNGNQPFTISAAFPANSTFVQTSPSNTCVAPGGSAAATILEPAGSCALDYTFTPPSDGPFNLSGTLATTPQTLVGSSGAGVINLSGTGEGATTTAPNPVLTPTTMSFGNVPIGTVSANQTATLKNTGTAALQVFQFNVTGTNPGGFGYTDNCGNSLAAGASCSIEINCDPAIVETLTATIHANFPSPIPQQSIALSCNGVAFSAALTPTTASFTAASGSTSTAQTFTLANGGNAALAITSVSFGGTNASSFKISSNTCGSSLAGNSSCTLAVTFSPASVGSFSASLSVVDAVGTQTSILAGTGTAAAAPQAVLTPSTIDFGSLTEGTTSTAQTATLKNTGGAALTISSFGFFGTDVGSFKETNNCGSTLAAGASCSIAITCTPGHVGALSANLGANFPSPLPQQSIALSCTGTAVPAPTATLTPATANFGNQTIGTTSAAQTFTLANSGGSALDITGIQLVPANGSAFAISSKTCGTSLAAGTSCTISVTFAPTAAGSATATLSVSDNATGSPQSSSLTGMGTAPAAPAATLTPAKLDFGSIKSGTKSTAQTATLTNTGNAALTITGISLTGMNSAAFATTNTCGSTLAAGASCAISVTFDPTATGSDTAVLSVNDNAAGSPQTSSLTGVATAPPPAADFALTATPASQSVASGSSAMYTVNVASVNGSYAQPVALIASGLPTGATVSFAPTTVTPGTSGAISSMTIQTLAQQASVQDAKSPNNSPSRWPVSVGLVSTALLILPFRRRRRILSSLACLLLLLGIGGALSACGGGFALPQTKPTSATYTVTVTGTSGSLQHSTSVQITVR